MLTTYYETKRANAKEDEEEKMREIAAHVLGIVLLVVGCVLIVLSLITIIIAAVKYMRTKTEPPAVSPENPDQDDTAWSQLENAPEEAATAQSPINNP